MSRRMNTRPWLLSLFAFSAILQAESALKLAPPTIKTAPGGKVTLISDTPETTILYTLDGTDPIAKSNPYLAFIDIPHGGILKARTFSKDRKTMSDVAESKLRPVPSFSIPIPSTLVPCTQDRSWPQYDWKTRHELTSAAVKKQQPQILFIGDSITHFFGGEQFDSYALRGKNTWDEFYAPRNAGNLGFGWDRTENVLWRLQHGAIDGIAPKVVVIMIGTNNTGINAAPDIAQGIEGIVWEFQQRLPQSKILLLGIFPRGEKPGPQRDKITEINGIIARLDQTRNKSSTSVARENNVTFLDIGAKFLTPEGIITKDIMPRLPPSE